MPYILPLLNLFAIVLRQLYCNGSVRQNDADDADGGDDGIDRWLDRQPQNVYIYPTYMNLLKCECGRAINVWINEEVI